MKKHPRHDAQISAPPGCSPTTSTICLPIFQDGKIVPDRNDPIVASFRYDNQQRKFVRWRKEPGLVKKNKQGAFWRVLSVSGRVFLTTFVLINHCLYCLACRWLQKCSPTFPASRTRRYVKHTNALDGGNHSRRSYPATHLATNFTFGAFLGGLGTALAITNVFGGFDINRQ